MRAEFAIRDEWLPFEVHPETPPQGVLLSEYFEGLDTAGFFREMEKRGAEFGIRFGTQTRLSNSRKALEAGEFARASGRYEAYHEAVFRAYFTDCLDIGETAVILAAAGEAGLDQAALKAALDAGAFTRTVVEGTDRARRLGVRAAPTFFIRGYGSITGAQPLETFRQALRRAGTNPPGARTL